MVAEKNHHLGAHLIIHCLKFEQESENYRQLLLWHYIVACCTFAAD